MALKPPGTRSNLQLVVTLAWTGVMLVGLIGGHVIIGWLILSAVFGRLYRGVGADRGARVRAHV